MHTGIYIYIPGAPGTVCPKPESCWAAFCQPQEAEAQASRSAAEADISSGCGVQSKGASGRGPIVKYKGCTGYAGAIIYIYRYMHIGYGML